MSHSDAPQVVSTDKAPAAVGPYSQAVIVENLVFISGQLPLDPATGSFAPGEIEDRTQQCLQNVQAIAQAAGTSLERAVKLTVYLTDMDDFNRVNQAYAHYFPAAPPARVAIQVAALPKGADIEIDAVVSL